ncbi:MAG TPA: hypothetical protein VGS19_03385 [Streptosporangiaceae bacterium]|nr:hypothetical protein [Streptosporangiaceae bacterium]
MTQAEPETRILEPGTPLVKAIPPRLVEPYLSGQRSVIAGYVYRAAECTFSDPAGFFHALRLGYPGSDFSAEMPELFLMCWPALDMSASLVPLPPANSYGPAPTAEEFFTLPIPIPVGAEIQRVTHGGRDLVARFDGQAWLRRSPR